MPPAIVVVYVGDDGPGIPEGEREAVLEQGVSGTASGTGYGLAIVTDIVEGHGWSIEVGETDAGGARFEIGHIYSMESDIRGDAGVFPPRDSCVRNSRNEPTPLGQQWGRRSTPWRCSRRATPISRSWEVGTSPR